MPLNTGYKDLLNAQPKVPDQGAVGRINFPLESINYTKLAGGSMRKKKCDCIPDKKEFNQFLNYFSTASVRNLMTILFKSVKAQTFNISKPNTVTMALQIHKLKNYYCDTIILGLPVIKIQT